MAEERAGPVDQRDLSRFRLGSEDGQIVRRVRHQLTWEALAACVWSVCAAVTSASLSACALGVLHQYGA